MRYAGAARQTYSDALSRLVFALRRAKVAGDGAAFLLGAGCSLTSARRDASTTSILRSIVTEIQPREGKTDDANLYRVFVKHWRNLSSSSRKALVEQRLADLEPSAGYLALRRLVELGYVSHIVTTNFDLLIDEILDGLPYAVRVGTAAWHPQNPGVHELRLIKVHGDIRNGQLRFDPQDLDELPNTIRDEVQRATDRTTLVCGFRGQDRGLMVALSENNRFEAFWSSPEFPDAHQDYIYDKLDGWMRQRSSAGNYICGTLGRFDDLMEALVEQLAQTSVAVSVRRMPAIWSSTVVGRLIGSNSRVDELFTAVLASTEAFASARAWSPQSPSFAASYRAVLETFSALVLPGGFVTVFGQALSNEIDGLFLGACIEFFARLCGWPHPPAEFVQGVRVTLERGHPTLGFDDAFWNELLRVCEGKPSLSRHADFKLRLNNSNRLSMIASRVPTQLLGDACVTMAAITAMSVPLDRDAADVSHHGSVKSVSAIAAQSLSMREAKGYIYLDGVTEEFFREIIAQYAANLPSGRIVSKGRFESAYLEVEAKIVQEVRLPARSVINSLLSAVAEKAARSHTALAAADVKTVKLQHDEEIQRFLQSAVPTAFLVGPSGAGKSTTVRRLVDEGRRIIALSGASLGHDKSAAQSFFGTDLIPTDADVGRLVERLDGALRLRGQRLLLVLDGLNEAGRGTVELSMSFGSLVNLAETLFEKGATNIKLLVTCQERTLLSLLNGSRRVSVGVFYLPTRISSAHDARGPFIRTRYLTVEEQREMVLASFPSERGAAFVAHLSETPALQAALDQPILISIAAQLPALDVEALADKPILVFDRYSALLTARAAAATQIGAVAAILRAYFGMLLSGDHENRVQRFVLLQRTQATIGVIAQEAIKVLEDVGVFKAEDSGVVGYLSFCHERLEISLLADYLDACSGEPEKLADLLGKTASSFKLLEGFRALILRKTTLSPAEDSFLAALFTFDLENLPWLSSILADILVESRKPEETLALLFRFTSRSGSEAVLTMARALTRGLSAQVDRGLIRPRTACELLIEQTTSFPGKRAGRAELHLAASQCAFSEDDRFGAERHIIEAAKNIGTRPDAKLKHRINLQRARILGRWESRAQALKILRRQFADILESGPNEAVVECSLEYGDMLRDAALFNDALDVYRQAEAFAGSAPNILQNRLHLQRAIAIKNKMQLILRSARRMRSRPTDEDVERASMLFQEAMEQFEAVLKWAKETGAVGLMLAALSERSEATIILSWARQDLAVSAKIFLNDLEQGLRLQNVVTHRIEWGRQVARLAEIEGRYSDAALALTEARATATAAGQAYNVCDCDYQLGRLALYALLDGDVTYVSTGQAALNRAAEYLRKETKTDNVYLEDVLDIMTKLADHRSKP